MSEPPVSEPPALDDLTVERDDAETVGKTAWRCYWRCPNPQRRQSPKLSWNGAPFCIFPHSRKGRLRSPQSRQSSNPFSPQDVPPHGGHRRQEGGASRVPLRLGRRWRVWRPPPYRRRCSAWSRAERGLDGPRRTPAAPGSGGKSVRERRAIHARRLLHNHLDALGKAFQIAPSSY